MSRPATIADYKRGGNTGFLGRCVGGHDSAFWFAGMGLSENATLADVVHDRPLRCERCGGRVVRALAEWVVVDGRMRGHRPRNRPVRLPGLRPSGKLQSRFRAQG